MSDTEKRTKHSEIVFTVFFIQFPPQHCQHIPTCNVIIPVNVLKCILKCFYCINSDNLLVFQQYGSVFYKSTTPMLYITAWGCVTNHPPPLTESEVEEKQTGIGLVLLNLKVIQTVLKSLL